MPRADDEIDRALEVWPQGPERFSRQTAQASPRGRVAGPFGDRQAQAWRSIRVPNRTGDHVQMAALSAPTTLKHPVKFGLALQPTGATQSTDWPGRLAAVRRRVRRVSRRQRRDHFVETVKRRRPLARRRFSTARPFLVAVRARKPWVRRREILLGLPRPFFTLRSSVHGLSRSLLWPTSAVSWRAGHTSAKDAGAKVYTNLWKMRVPCATAQVQPELLGWCDTAGRGDRFTRCRGILATRSSVRRSRTRRPMRTVSQPDDFYRL